jgi:hypothetical protein
MSERHEYEKKIEALQEEGNKEDLELMRNLAKVEITESEDLEKVLEKIAAAIAALEGRADAASEVSGYQKKEIEDLGGSMDEIEEQVAEIRAEADKVVGESGDKMRFLVENKPGEFLVEGQKPVGFVVENELEQEKKRQMEAYERNLKALENKIGTFEKMTSLEGDLQNASFEVLPVDGYPGNAWLRFDDELTREFENLYSRMRVSPFIAGADEAYLRKKLEGSSEEQIQDQIDIKKKIESIRDEMYEKYGFGNVYLRGAEAFSERMRCYPVLSVGNNTYFTMADSEDSLSGKKLTAKTYAEIVLKDLQNKKKELEDKIEELI